MAFKQRTQASNPVRGTFSVGHMQSGVVFYDAQAARVGPSALDLLAGDGMTEHAILRNVEAPLLVLGLAGVLSKQYNSIVRARLCQRRACPYGIRRSSNIRRGLLLTLRRGRYGGSRGLA